MTEPRVRCLQRIGRRGLSSACVEGMLASAAPYLAVMDADLQHDERILPRMLNASARTRPTWPSVAATWRAVATEFPGRSGQNQPDRDPHGTRSNPSIRGRPHEWILHAHSKLFHDTVRYSPLPGSRSCSTSWLPLPQGVRVREVLTTSANDRRAKANWIRRQPGTTWYCYWTRRSAGTCRPAS